MSLVDRAKNIITSPKTEWAVIAGEEANTGAIVTGYVVPMALIPAVANFIGWGFVGVVGFHGMEWGLAYAILSFLTTLLAVFITAFVVDLLAPTFTSQKNFGRAMQLVAYSFTPAWIGGILNVFPVIGWIGGLFGLYGLYLLYLGLPHMMQTPQDKVVVYLIVSIVVLIVAYVIIGAIFAAVIFGIFGLSAVTMMG